MSKKVNITVSQIIESLKPISGDKPSVVINDGYERVVAMDSNFTTCSMSIKNMLEKYGERRVVKYEVRSWTCLFYDSADIYLWLDC